MTSFSSAKNKMPHFHEVIRVGKNRGLKNTRADRLRAALKKKKLYLETLWRKKKKNPLFSENPFIYYNTQRMTSEVRWFVHQHDWMRADLIRQMMQEEKKKKTVYRQTASSFISSSSCWTPSFTQHPHPHPPTLTPPTWTSIPSLQCVLQYPTSQNIEMGFWPRSILNISPLIRTHTHP